MILNDLRLLSPMLTLPIRCRLFALLLIALTSQAQVALSSPPNTYTLKGKVENEQNQPIHDALCTINGGLLPAEGLSVKSDYKGEFQIEGLLPSAYDISCAAVGYEPVSKAGLQVDENLPAEVDFVLTGKIVVRQRVEVHEKAPEVSSQNAAPPAQLKAVQLQSLPLAEQKFKAALPMIPGVIRTPDGKINIKGVAEGQSLLQVNSATTADPITGSFSIDVPYVAIESLQVYKTSYQAANRGFSGGLTSIQLRSPSDQWHYELQALTPNPRIEAGTLVGIADYNPRLYLTGPLVKNRLNFSESLGFDVDKQPVRGLPWPHNEIKTQDLSSLTSFQFIASPQHLITANANVFPVRKQFANINSLVPQSASSDYGQNGFSIGVKDRYLASSGLGSTTLFQFTRFDDNAHGQGPADMLVTPEGWAGNFFNSYDRTSSQEEITQAFQLPRKDWHGKHEFTLGAEILHRTYSGTSNSRPIQILREDGTVAEQIDFTGGGALGATDTEISAFAQDHWMMGERLAMDAGLRFSRYSIGRSAAFAPRIGLVYSPGNGDKTVLRGGVGIFFDNAPLLAGRFTQNPARTISFFDATGALTGPPVVFRNAYLQNASAGSAFSFNQTHPASTPYNLTWNLEADREIRPNTVLRLSYLSSQTLHGLILDPVTLNATEGALVLSGSGNSRYREFESTLRVVPSQDSEFSVSYIRSLARGDLNTLDRIYVPFAEPVIRQDFYAPLPSDVPNRLIAWGRFPTHFWGIEAGPFFDIHTGFPYSIVDELQSYVGKANSLRFPTFLSLDLKLGKEFTLPFPWIKNHRMRGSLTVLNLTNHSNPRDVFNNITSPVFGHFVGFQHRSLETALDIIY
jgi:Carboxypeptidase regulatory-like domain